MAKRQEASTGQIVDDGKPEVTPPKGKATSIQVKVHSPFKVYFEGEAENLSAENNTGPFDILPEHHNFITLLNACELIIRTKEEERRIKIARGIMHVKDNYVNVFLDV